MEVWSQILLHAGGLQIFARITCSAQFQSLLRVGYKKLRTNLKINFFNYSASEGASGRINGFGHKTHKKPVLLIIIMEPSARPAS